MWVKKMVFLILLAVMSLAMIVSAFASESLSPAEVKADFFESDANAAEISAAALVSKIEFDGFSTEEREEIINDLIYLGQIKTVLPAGIDGRSLYPFLGGEIDGRQILELIVSKVKWIKNGRHICKAAGGCADYGSDTIYINSIKDESSLWWRRVARVEIIMHEFYHIIKKSEHLYCPATGRQACDNDLSGAYGFSAFVILNMAKYCTNCDPQFHGNATVHGIGRTDHILIYGKEVLKSMMNEPCPPGYTQEVNPGYRDKDLYPICNFNPMPVFSNQHLAKR